MHHNVFNKMLLTPRIIGIYTYILYYYLILTAVDGQNNYLDPPGTGLAVGLQEASDSAACGPGTFSCGTTPKECLQQKLWCNEVRDCDNGADEVMENCIDNEGYHSWLLSSGLFDRPYINQTMQRGRNECVLTDYPEECVCTRYTRLDCRSRGLTTVPLTSIHLTKLFLQNNALFEVHSSSFAGYPNLEFIQMKNCSIHKLHDNVFDNLERLRILYLDNNNLETLPDGLFLNQHSLEWLFMQDNNLSYWKPGLFAIFHKPIFIENMTGIDNLTSISPIVWFNFSSNRLKFEEARMFSGVTQISSLEAGNNPIRKPHRDVFRNLTHLRFLGLQNNEIVEIPDELFDDLHSLIDLDLSNNKLTTLRRRPFKKLRNLDKLILAHNPVTSIDVEFLADLPNLSSLDLRGIVIPDIDIAMFQANKNLSYIYFKSFAYCSFAPHVRVCRPNTDGISTLADLLSNPLLRVSVWIMAAITCMFNLTVLVTRLAMRDTNISVLFICNLSGTISII